MDPVPSATQHQTRPAPAPNVTQRVLTVYLFLICGLTITALTTAALFQVNLVLDFVRNHFIITMVLTSLLLTVNTSMFTRVYYEEQKASKMLYWTLNCALAGVPLLNVDAFVLAKTALYTVVLFLILSLKSFIIPESVIEMFLRPLTAIHTLVLVCTAYSILFSSLNSTVTLIITSITLHGGFIVYSGLLICNTQRLLLNVKHSRFDPVFSSFVLYMNILNLFSRVAVFSTIKTVVQAKECSKK